MRLRGITPAGLMRFLLVAGALVALGWLIKTTWLALVPFVIGAIIAYILLPVVNWLDRWLPRWLAVILTLLGAAAVAVGVLALLIPPIFDQLFRLYLLTPGLDELRDYIDQFRRYVRTLPEPTQATIVELAQQVAAKVRANLDVFLTELVNLTLTTVLGLVNTIGFLLGFLIIPAWLLSVLHDQETGVRALNRLLPETMRADFWAVLRIFDRSLRAFVQGQLLLGVLVGLLVYLGLSLLELLGWPVIPYKLLLAMFAGLMQLIPSIGPFLGTIPAIISGLVVSLEMTLAILAVYIAAQLLVNNLVVPHIERRVVDIHPAVLVIAVVALSEFGLWWVLLAAPITAIIRDLFRYVYGRFSEPPRPAGRLPGELYPPESETRASNLSLQASGRRIPLVYRRGRALPRAER
jgi:predicted PurR-regulated permease PerM